MAPRKVPARSRALVCSDWNDWMNDSGSGAREARSGGWEQMELLTGVGTDGATDACSAAELNDAVTVRLGLCIGFATELVDARQLGVERAARVAAGGCELSERHG